MRHFILTRAAYPAALWPEDANRRRLDLFRATTVASLKAQIAQNPLLPAGPPTWILALHPDDQLAGDRLEAAWETGLPVSTIEVTDTPPKRSQLAIAAYKAPWREAMAYSGSARQRITTRLDDDDALTANHISRIQTWVAANNPTRPTAVILPNGHRLWDGRITPVRHETNAMASLYTPTWDGPAIYDTMHRQVRNHYPVRHPDHQPAWLWVRHPDTLSGWRRASETLTPRIRRLYPIDWDNIDLTPTSPPVPGGTTFK